LTQALTAFETALSASALAVDGELGLLFPKRGGDRLRDAMRYAVLGQGKRLRPFLVLQSARLFDVSAQGAMRVAAALECVHCYSLVHDDLPAMDNDDLRRGKPTVHRKFDEATAILCGDGLLTSAFEIIATANFPAETQMQLVLNLALSSGAAGMVGGQMLDIEAETKNFSNVDDIAAMQAKKTGALFRFACEAGAIMAKKDATALRQYADYIGLAFQVADDILDVEADAATLGKATQKDQSRGKATFVDFYGLQGAKSKAIDLHDQAIAALSVFDHKADLLRDAAQFIIMRKK
jgi:farnesyl diphosphate synthase